MTAAVSPALTDELIKEYDTNGAVCVRGVFSEDWLRDLHAGMDEVLARPLRNLAPKPHNMPDGFEINQHRWRDVDNYRRFVLESPAAEIAGRLMQANKVNFHEDVSFHVQAGVEGTTDWHQDIPYYNVAGKMLSIWMPLQPLSKHDGLRVIAGSHRWGKIFSPFGANENRPGYEPLPIIDERDHEILAWDLEPGDGIAFSAYALHAVLPDTHNQVSRRFSTRWTGDATFHARGGMCSRRSTEVDLVEGGPLDCDWYPVVWEADRPRS